MTTRVVTFIFHPVVFDTRSNFLDELVFVSHFGVVVFAFMIVFMIVIVIVIVFVLTLVVDIVDI